jgi:N-ethylmaleimide reductase
MAASASAEPLFQPLRLGALHLAHRVVMCPLTRRRALRPGCVPGPMNAEYYAQRATEGGLIVSEATNISPGAQGIPDTPGIFSPEQVEGWRGVVDAVHKKKGLIVLQLW